jgi:hypothetical protein
MIAITPLTSKELENASKEFFAKEFVSSRLGTLGHWLGSGAEKLMLENPVTLAQFQNLARGLTPDGGGRTLPENLGPKCISGWQIKFDGSQSLSVLWALAPEKHRTNIESAHLTAVCESFHIFEAIVNRDPKEKAGLFSVFFNAGASHDQCPHLCATAFVFKQAACGTGPAHTYVDVDIERHKAELAYYYEGSLDYFVWKTIGPFNRQPGCDELRIVGVPQEVVLKFFYGRSSALAFDGELAPGDSLFAKWQSQAKDWGWGPKEAEALLKTLHYKQELESLRERFRQDVRENKAKIERAWNSVVAVVTREPRSRNPEDDARIKEHERERGR